MSVARAGHTATLLADGRVLVAGGGTKSAELYDPSKGAWSTTGSMSVARTGATATLLSDGMVLVAGGCCNGGLGLASAELYDPGTGKWSSTGGLKVPRVGHTATLLADGEVLVTGGACEFGCSNASFFSNLASAELYNPATGKWSLTGSMHVGREFHTATLLSAGMVLVAGGFSGCDDSFCSSVAEAELYDAATGTWSTTRSMHVAREQQLASLLPDGRVLVAGGLDQGGFGSGHIWTSAEIYDPSGATWTTVASMASPHLGGTATLVAGGWVLVAGGGTNTAELYQPRPNVWVPPGAMSSSRTQLTATRLRDGRVLVTGGNGGDGRPQATAELYLTGRGPLVGVRPASLSFGSHLVGTRTALTSFRVTNYGTAALQTVGVVITGADPGDFVATTTCAQALVAPGGSCSVSARFAPGATGPRSATIAIDDNSPGSPHGDLASGYGSGPGAFAPSGTMNAARDNATATLLGNGKVLIAGGGPDPTTQLSSAELYDPTTFTLTPTGALHSPRTSASAVRLQTGKVLIAGGISTNFVRLATAELYDPATGTWTPTGSMPSSGDSLTATSLGDGRVLVTGLSSGPGAAVYNPASGAWTDTGPMTAAHSLGAAVLLGDGKVLVAGGGTTAAELYDPPANTWTATGSLNVGRTRETLTALPNGKVLAVGGNPASCCSAPLASAELYDPTSGSWRLTGSMSTGRFGHTASLLPDGRVLVAGGCTSFCNPNIVATTEIFDPTYAYWQAGPTMTVPRENHTATVLADGDLLVTGGDSIDCCTATSSTEILTNANLVVSPASGPSGTRVTVSGSGFFADETVAVRFAGGGRLAMTVTANDGTFVVKVTIPTAAPGHHQLTADGHTSAAFAAASFLVT
jgi:N-acetylneuraminic acid mutarotase